MQFKRIVKQIVEKLHKPYHGNIVQPSFKSLMPSLELATPTQRIVDAVTEAVLAQRLVPGTKLNEAEMADIFGVGRTVIRQALIRLAQDKLVTIEHNRGAHITELSDLEIRETFEVLAMLECAALEKFIKTITAFDIAKLRQHIAHQSGAHQHHDIDQEFRLGPDFHVLIVGLAHNRVLEDIHGKLTAQERLITSQYYGEFDHVHLCQDHSQLIDLIESGDLVRAQQLLVGHYRTLESYCIGRKQRKAMIPLSEAFRDLVDAGDNAA